MWLLETSPLLCFANQWINFYKKETSVILSQVKQEQSP